LAANKYQYPVPIFILSGAPTPDAAAGRPNAPQVPGNLIDVNFGRA
jgi:hypothetical protein